MRCVSVTVLIAVTVLVVGACERAPRTSEPPGTLQTPAESGASVPAMPSVEPPMSTGVPQARITQSSVLEKYDASGLLKASEPGWHAARNPTYPQAVTIEFEESRTLQRISLLPQDTLSVRGPKSVDVETSEDGTKWTRVYSIPDACQGQENRWRTFGMSKPIAARWLRLTIHSNCGDPDLLTLRGLRVE